jgi:hypothetical protein
MPFRITYSPATKYGTSFAGGEDEGYFGTPKAAGSIPAMASAL